MAKPAKPIDVNNLPFWVTVEEYAEIRRVGRTAAYDACKRGEILHERIGKLIRIHRDVALGRQPA